MSGEVRMTRQRAKKLKNMKQQQQNGSEISPHVEVNSFSSASSQEEDLDSADHIQVAETEIIKIKDKIEKTESPPLVLWRNPVTVLHYSACELMLNLLEGGKALLKYKTSLAAFGLVLVMLVLAHFVPGSHQESLVSVEKYLIWCAWWVGLGILSSVGLGTGLHTFLLYLGPHIAAVTMAAYECGTTDFPSPPYPSQIICPPSPDEERAANAIKMTVWAILSKVRVEAFCWGAGTAIGELPPYFMARAARLSGSEPGRNGRIS